MSLLITGHFVEVCFCSNAFVAEASQAGFCTGSNHVPLAPEEDTLILHVVFLVAMIAAHLLNFAA